MQWHEIYTDRTRTHLIIFCLQHLDALLQRIAFRHESLLGLLKFLLENVNRKKNWLKMLTGKKKLKLLPINTDSKRSEI